MCSPESNLWFRAAYQVSKLAGDCFPLHTVVVEPEWGAECLLSLNIGSHIAPTTIMLPPVCSADSWPVGLQHSSVSFQRLFFGSSFRAYWCL